MLDPVFLLLFSAVSIGTVMAAWLLLGKNTQAVERIKERPKVGPVMPVSSAMGWRELVARAGQWIPASTKDSPALKRRLISAGWRHPRAPHYMQAARTVMIALLAAAGVITALVLHFPLPRVVLMGCAGAIAGHILPNRLLLIKINRRRKAIAKGLPHVLDLMVVCVESGLGMDQATLQVAKELQHAYPALCDEFTVMNLELRAGKRRTEALHNLSERAGVDDLKKLAAVLIQADKFGTSIGQTLRSHSDYMRVMTRQRAEEQAAKLAVKLVFPIFFFILPALFVVTLGPVVMKMINELMPMLDRM